MLKCMVADPMDETVKWVPCDECGEPVAVPAGSLVGPGYGYLCYDCGAARLSPDELAELDNTPCLQN